jgi:hypothetical protein
MSCTRSHPPLGERRRRLAAPRTFVRAVVTEVAVVLEPASRDPFLDGCADGAGRRPVVRLPRRPVPSGR